jgi:hypothetical protein
LIFRPAVFDGDILAVYITGLLETELEPIQEGRESSKRPAMKEAYHRQRRLLCPRFNRPRRRRAAE